MRDLSVLRRVREGAEGRGGEKETTTERKTTMATKEKLIACRETYMDGGCQFIELTHQDGRVSAISNSGAIRVMMNALKGELDRQIASA